VVSRRRRESPRPAGAAAAASSAPLSDREIDELQALLDRVPAPLEALDVSSLDGFLCGVIVQPQRIAPARWRPFITDVDGRALPSGFDTARLIAQTARREAELRAAIERRAWFDPWIFELADDAPATAQGQAASVTAAVDALYPWVAGFAAALETFPGLLALDEAALLEPLALLYRHLGSDDLDDAEALLAEIESLEPPADLASAVEEIVRATLLLADAAGVRRMP
jgi:uncharacterized protein